MSLLAYKHNSSFQRALSGLQSVDQAAGDMSGKAGTELQGSLGELSDRQAQLRQQALRQRDALKVRRRHLLCIRFLGLHKYRFSLFSTFSLPTHTCNGQQDFRQEGYSLL